MAKSLWLNNFDSLSRTQKIILVTLVFALIFGGGFWWYRSKASQNTTNQQSQSQSSAQVSNNDQKLINTESSGQRKILESDYPSILVNHKSNPKIGFNLALNQNESSSVYGYDRKQKVTKKLYNYLQLPYRATNTSTKVNNNFILRNFQLDPQSDQTLTQISWVYFDDQKQANQKDYIGEIPLAYTTTGKNLDNDQSKSIPENVIWYGFSDNSPEILPKKDSDYGKAEYINQSVYIYTKSLKNNVGTYLKDIKNDLEYKISDQYCSSIFFSKIDFWCLNSQRKLVNLTTNADLGEYSKIVTTDRGVVYATRNVDDLYSVIDLITFSDNGEPIIKSNIFETKQGEIITYIAFTNQQELLIQINRGQNLEYQESIKNGEKIKELYTVEFQNKDGAINLVPHLEFDQFTVIF